LGGFEGGDEGGYWDVDTLYSSVNKTKTKKDTFIEIKDSVYSIKAYAKADDAELFDTMSFVPCDCTDFTIEGCEDIPQEKNSIFLAFKALNDYVADPDVLEFFTEHKVVVTKRIPLGKGYGGSMADAAAFLLLTKEACNLVLSTKELIDIGSEFGEDFSYFIDNYPSADGF
jgi:4-diphosphocytidyl-2C-methyl-D-erythritol kinase